MRIVVVNVNRAIVGGVETYLQAVLPRLHEAGHTLGLLTERHVPPGAADLAEDAPVTESWVTSDAGATKTLDAVAAWGPDVVYLQGAIDPDLTAGLGARFPLVLYAHTYFGTCISGTKCQTVYPRPCDRTFGFACLGLYLPRRCGGRNPLTMFRAFREQRRRLAVVLRAKAVLTASRHMRDEYARHGVPGERLHLLPLFPPGVRPDPRPPMPRPRSGRVLFVGRITALKGWRQLLDAITLAAARLDLPLTLVVAGDGPEQDQFKEEARRKGIAAEFLGWVGPEKREAEMRAADVLVVPSVWPEPFGLVGVEAGCVGLPAVAFAVGGIPDWLESGTSGELAPGDPPTASGLANALVRAIGDPRHLARLVYGAWESARKFTPERHLERLEAVLAQTVT